MKKTLAIILACLMFVLMFAGCKDNSGQNTGNPDSTAPTETSAGNTAEPSGEEQTLYLRKTASLQSTNWEATTNTFDMQITWVQVFEGLYGMNEANGGYYNLLAKDIQVSDDGLVYTITLVDATFQNGDPLTAQDVVFSYNKAMQNSRFNYVTAMIDKIEAVDEKTVTMTLKYAYSAIAHTFWSIKISSEKEVTAAGDTYGTLPHKAGTGPYYVETYDVASGVVLHAYEGYWQGAPDIKRVEYRVISEDSAAVIAFENGEIDYLNDAPLSEWENIAAAAGENCTLVKGNNIRFMAINYLSPTNDNVLGNPLVREAIFYAVNKDNIVLASTNGYGQKAYEYMPHEYVATSPNYEDGSFKIFDYDPQKCHDLLIQAGFTEEQIAAGIDIGKITTYGAETAEKGKAAVVIQASLAECGFKAEVEIGEAANITPRLYTQDYDICIFADSGNYDYNNIRQQVDSESTGMYVVRYKDDASPFDWEQIEALVDQGVATSDVKARYDIYTQLWTIIMDTATILPLYHNAVGVAWSSKIDPGSVNPTYYHIADFTWVD
ncbi:MAG TPA: ABC transporter substrate-binding protein [Clostridia bacterium]|nr:ABC transporter substrate-binding protein [Clostridia bacterium]